MAGPAVNLAPNEPHLLDTSAVVHLIRRRVSAGAEAFVPFATLGELATGTFRADDQGDEAANVRDALGLALPLFATEGTTVHFGRINAHLQRTGQTLPHNDVWNAALALEYDLALLGDDEHFRRVPGLRYLPLR